MRAIFLDRDGVINELVYHQEAGIIDSPFTQPQFKLLPRVGEAIRLAKELGMKIIVVSNQPGIAKKHFSEKTLKIIDKKMKEDLKKENAYLDGIYYCLHHPEAINEKYKRECKCRKPEPGLLLTAAQDFGIDLSSSYMIGDSITDIETGHRAGCKTLLVGRLKCELCKLMDERNTKPDFIVKDLYDGVELIRRMENGW